VAWAKGDHPQACAGALAIAKNDVATMQDCASNFGEGNIAARIA
jgi:hypothetical protein